MELGRLGALGRLIPDAALFLYGYVRREAVLSSQIEGTQSSLSDLLRYENDAATGVPEDDVEEISNYVAAMTHGLERMRDGFPLSLRLIREMHGVLMRGGRGAHADAGEFRRTQNWIGGHRPGTARFVPPPAHEALPAMRALERFLHTPPESMSPIVVAGLAHVQFETIHPFLDGNGRLGRLLITCILCARGVLTQPLLYLSLFFKNHRPAYYDLLSRVREDGDWERWLQFYLEGVRDVSRGACEKAQRILDLFARDAQRVTLLRRKRKVAGAVYTLLKEHGMVSATIAARELSMTFPTATAALAELETLGIVREITGQRRDRVYAYQAYLDVLSAD